MAPGNMLRLSADENLVARTLAGDRNAFRSLVERHYSAVFRLCRSILHHTQDAEDATQEVFLRAYSALGQYSGRGAFGSWLRRLTVNHCINRTQTASARAAALSCSLELLTSTLPAGDDANPERSLLRSEERARVLTELELLPPQQRAALGLRLLEDLSYDEIAELMGVPVNSVRSWLHRGRLRLQAALHEEPECETV